MHEAAAHGHHEIVRILLEDDRVEPDVATHMGETSLMLAAKKVGFEFFTAPISILHS